VVHLDLPYVWEQRHAAEGKEKGQDRHHAKESAPQERATEQAGVKEAT
jgi:hypothetical protein